MHELQSPARRHFLRGRVGHPAATATGALRLCIDDACFARQGTVCRSCGDACALRAIHFIPRLGAAAWPEILAEACNGCGDCVTACPAAAIVSRESP